MDPHDALTAVVALLALTGYYSCLRMQLIATLVFSAGFAWYLNQIFPIDGAYTSYWAGAGAFIFILTGLAFRHKLQEKQIPALQSPTKQQRGNPRDQKEIVIDGTNVLYWDGDGAQLATLRIVVDYLRQKGYAPIVFLDASSRHHLGNKSLNEKGFARALSLSRDKVRVCPANTEADVFILEFANQQGLPVLSNDRFSDRPAQAKGLKIVKGVMVSGRPILDGL